jgi:hypothetical protein
MQKPESGWKFGFSSYSPGWFYLSPAAVASGVGKVTGRMELPNGSNSKVL